MFPFFGATFCTICSVVFTNFFVILVGFVLFFELLFWEWHLLLILLKNKSMWNISWSWYCWHSCPSHVLFLFFLKIFDLQGLLLISLINLVLSLFFSLTFSLYKICSVSFYLYNFFFFLHFNVWKQQYTISTRFSFLLTTISTFLFLKSFVKM